MTACARLRAVAARRPESGFTLIEVLVALVIVAFGMSAVFVALTSAANGTMRLREKTFAEWVGFNQLATVRLSASTPSTGSSEGDAIFAGIRWHCRQTVETMNIPGLLRVTIQVRYADANSTSPTGSQNGASGGGRTGIGKSGNVSSTLSTGGTTGVSATNRCIDPSAGGGGSSSSSSANATWLATVVGFYGMGALLSAPQGTLTWDTATSASSSGNTTTPTTPGVLPTTTPPSSSTTPPTPIGAGTP